MQPILIVSVNSKVGVEAAAELIRRGRAVRGGVRSAPKESTPGIETVVADLDKPDTLAAAFDGVETAILSTAADTAQPQQHSNFLNAARKAGVKRIIRISVVGANPESSIELERMNGQTDREFADSGIATTVLHPQSFMQNFLGQVGTMRAMGKVFSCTGNGKIPFVDARDIGAAAAACALQNASAGKAYEITGPEGVSYAQVAEKFSSALGVPVEFVNIAEEAATDGMTAAGLPPWAARSLAAIHSGYSRGENTQVSDDVERLTGRAPISFDRFLADHKAMLSAIA
jgi:uncharacterized protein YbjT (DUF2867 family)